MASQQALPGKRLTSFGMSPTEILIVGIDFDGGANHPLLEEDRNALPIDDGLVKSLSMHGNLQEIVVRKDEEGRPLVVFGRQRVRCMRVANEALVKAGKQPRLLRVRHERMTDLAAVSKAVTENAHRRNDTPMGKARKMQRMLDLGATDIQCAVAAGVSTTAIRQWKKLLDLAPEVQEAVDKGSKNGGISSSAAMNFAGLEQEEQVTQLSEALQAAADGKGKVTHKSTTRARQNRSKNTTGAKHMTAFKPPRSPILKKVSIIVADPEVKTAQLSSDASLMLDWVLGRVEASAIPGLVETLAAVEAANISKAQQKILDQLDAAEEGVVEIKTLNKKTVTAMVKRGLVEEFAHEDGLAYLRRVVVSDDSTEEASD